MAGPRKQIGRFAILSTGIYANRKIRKAGRLGREVFQFALTRNAERGLTGSFPASELEPWFIADQLQMSEQEAADGVQRACAADLVDIDVSTGVAAILGWDESWARAAIGESEARQLRRLRSARALPTKRPDPEDPDPKPDQDQDEREIRSEQSREVRTSPDIVRTESLSPLLLRLDRISERRERGHITWTEKARGELVALAQRHGEDEVALRWDNLLCRPEGEFPKTRTIGVFCQPNVFDECATRKVDLAQRVLDAEEAARDRPVLQTPPLIPHGFVKLSKSKVPEVYAVMTEPNEFGIGGDTVDHYQRFRDGVFARIEPVTGDVIGSAHLRKVELQRGGQWLDCDYLTTVFDLPDGGHVLVDADDAVRIAELTATHYPPGTPSAWDAFNASMGVPVEQSGVQAEQSAQPGDTTQKPVANNLNNSTNTDILDAADDAPISLEERREWAKQAKRVCK